MVQLSRERVWPGGTKQNESCMNWSNTSLLRFPHLPMHSHCSG